MKIEIPKLLERFGGSTVTNLLRLVDSKLRKIHTTTIGIIENFDIETQTAVIQPAIKRVLISENQETITYITENHPLLVNVPVVFPGGGDWFMTFPVKRGDECLIFSMERSIGNWKKNGGIQEPSNYKRKLSFKDAVAMVGIQSKASSLPNFNSDEPEIRNRDGSVKMVLNSNGLFVEGSLEVTGDIQASGDIIAGSGDLIPISVKNHVHGIAGANNGTLANGGGPVIGNTSPPERAL